jgi:hypothetical protein
MPVTYIMDFVDATTDQYDEVIARMQLNGKLAPGSLFHCAGATETGLRVMDVWETNDAFQRHAQEQIAPLTAAVGVGAPQVRMHEVAQLRRGRDEDVTFAQLIYLPGIDRAMFEDVDGRILADTGGGLPGGCVFHVNGSTDDGYYVMDAWTSQDLYDEFRDAHILPNVAAAGLTAAPRVENLPLHGSLRHPAAAGAAA